MSKDDMGKPAMEPDDIGNPELPEGLPADGDGTAADDGADAEEPVVPAGKETKEERRARKARKAWKDLTGEDDETPVNLSWRTIIGGDILASGWLRRHFWMVVLLTVFALVYVSNRYACQQEAIEQNQLNDTLLDRKYKALTRSSELLERMLRSNVEEELRDSTIRTSTTPLYEIKTDDEE